MAIPSFNPPPADSLAQVDQAEGVEYEGRCTIIEGVVAEGQGAWRGLSKHYDYDVHSFSFAGWRRPGEPIRTQDLLIMRPIPVYTDSDREFLKEFTDYSIQRFSLLLSKDQSRSVFERELPFDDVDEALTSFAKDLREPVVISISLFGPLTLNRRHGQF